MHFYELIFCESETKLTYMYEKNCNQCVRILSCCYYLLSVIRTFLFLKRHEHKTRIKLVEQYIYTEKILFFFFN